MTGGSSAGGTILLRRPASVHKPAGGRLVIKGWRAPSSTRLLTWIDGCSARPPV
ncbi:hypothetical protein [Muricoccus vinaceus]|uniref:Uncharacterized protein n=1 Tax=Muricoccus vinaceus TaxID=424704 RepID=A0ABV6IXP6_9PROT